MSLRSESGFMRFSDIIINGFRCDSTQDGTQEKCVDFFVLFPERDGKGDPGVHISIPLSRAKELARDMYNTAKIAEEESEIENYGEVAGRWEYNHDERNTRES